MAHSKQRKLRRIGVLKPGCQCVYCQPEYRGKREKLTCAKAFTDYVVWKIGGAEGEQQ